MKTLIKAEKAKKNVKASLDKIDISDAIQKINKQIEDASSRGEEAIVPDCDELSFDQVFTLICSLEDAGYYVSVTTVIKKGKVFNKIVEVSWEQQ